MTADRQLRDRLERAARVVDVDAELRLDRIRVDVARRARSRRTRAFAVAAAVTAVVVILAWQLRPIGDRRIRPAGIPAGRIAFLRDQADQRGLFELDVATGDVAALSADGGSVHWAAWSPDGSRIAYIVEEPGPRYAIVVADADGSDPVKIVEEEDTGAVGSDLIDLSWSPDGSQIAYSGRVVKDGVARRTILIVDADGSEDPVALDGLWVSVAWSPDGGRLLLSGFPSDDPQFDLYTVRPDGSELEQLTDDEVAEHEPSWSPDGTRIVFAMGASYFQDVFVMSADGSDIRRLTDWEGLDFLPVWSPDGRWIAFVSDRDATPAEQEANRSGEVLYTGLSLYMMRTDGSDISVLLERDSGFPVAWKA